MNNNAPAESPTHKRRGRPRKHHEAEEQLVKMEGLLNVAEVADFLRVHKGLVYQLVKTHGLPATKVGKHLRFYRFELLNWIERRRTSQSSSQKP